MKIMSLNKEEIQLLTDNDWEIVCESPLQFERYAQFAGGIHKLYSEEEQREEIEEIKKSQEYYNRKLKVNNEKEIYKLIFFIPEGNRKPFAVFNSTKQEAEKKIKEYYGEGIPNKITYYIKKENLNYFDKMNNE